MNSIKAAEAVADAEVTGDGVGFCPVGYCRSSSIVWNCNGDSGTVHIWLGKGQQKRRIPIAPGAVDFRASVQQAELRLPNGEGSGGLVLVNLRVLQGDSRNSASPIASGQEVIQSPGANVSWVEVQRLGGDGGMVASVVLKYDYKALKPCSSAIPPGCTKFDGDVAVREMLSWSRRLRFDYVHALNAWSAIRQSTGIMESELGVCWSAWGLVWDRPDGSSQNAHRGDLVFHLLDRDGNGLISANEFLNALDVDAYEPAPTGAPDCPWGATSISNKSECDLASQSYCKSVQCSVAYFCSMPAGCFVNRFTDDISCHAHKTGPASMRAIGFRNQICRKTSHDNLRSSSFSPTSDEAVERFRKNELFLVRLRIQNLDCALLQDPYTAEAVASSIRGAIFQKVGQIVANDVHIGDCVPCESGRTVVGVRARAMIGNHSVLDDTAGLVDLVTKRLRSSVDVKAAFEQDIAVMENATVRKEDYMWDKCEMGSHVAGTLDSHPDFATLGCTIISGFMLLVGLASSVFFCVRRRRPAGGGCAARCMRVRDDEKMSLLEGKEPDNLVTRLPSFEDRASNFLDTVNTMSSSLRPESPFVVAKLQAAAKGHKSLNGGSASSADVQERQRDLDWAQEASRTSSRATPKRQSHSKSDSAGNVPDRMDDRSDHKYDVDQAQPRPDSPKFQAAANGHKSLNGGSASSAGFQERQCHDVGGASSADSVAAPKGQSHSKSDSAENVPDRTYHRYDVDRAQLRPDSPSKFANGHKSLNGGSASSADVQGRQRDLEVGGASSADSVAAPRCQSHSKGDSAENIPDRTYHRSDHRYDLDQAQEAPRSSSCAAPSHKINCDAADEGVDIGIDDSKIAYQRYGIVGKERVPMHSHKQGRFVQNQVVYDY